MTIKRDFWLLLSALLTLIGSVLVLSCSQPPRETVGSYRYDVPDPELWMPVPAQVDDSINFTSDEFAEVEYLQRYNYVPGGAAILVASVTLPQNEPKESLTSYLEGYAARWDKKNVTMQNFQKGNFYINQVIVDTGEFYIIKEAVFYRYWNEGFVIDIVTVKAHVKAMDDTVSSILKSVRVRQ